MARRREGARLPLEIWAEVLGVERVGVHDNAFHLGGHSLLVMRFVAAARHAFGVEVPIQTMFLKTTLEAMATELEQRIYEDVLAMSEEAAALAALDSTPEG